MDGWNTIVSFRDGLFSGASGRVWQLLLESRWKNHDDPRVALISLPFSFQSWLKKTHWLEDFIRKRNPLIFIISNIIGTSSSCHVSISPHPGIASTNTKGMKRKRIRRNVPPEGRWAGTKVINQNPPDVVLNQLQPCNLRKKLAFKIQFYQDPFQPPNKQKTRDRKLLKTKQNWWQPSLYPLSRRL